MAGKSRNKGKKPSAQVLRAFRHDVSILKKKGLVSKRVDAREQRLTRYMKTKVKNYEGVIAGRESVVWRDPNITAQYREAGFKTASLGRNRKGVIVPTEQAQQIRANKNELMTIMTDIGNVTVERVILPVTVRNMDQFITKGITNPESIDKLKRPDQLFGFTYHNNRSLTTYDTVEHIAEDLRKYRSIDDDDTWENFVLVSIQAKDTLAWSWRPERRRQSIKTVQDRRLQTFRFVKKTNEEKADDHRREERERYARLKDRMSEQDKARQRELWTTRKRSERDGLKRNPK